MKLWFMKIQRGIAVFVAVMCSSNKNSSLILIKTVEDKDLSEQVKIEFNGKTVLL